MREVLSLSKFDDIKSADFFVNHIEIYGSVELTKPIKFNIFGQEIVECDDSIEFYKGGELKAIYPVKGDSYKGYCNEIRFYENGNIRDGYINGESTIFYGCKNDLQNVEIKEGLVSVKYSEDGKIEISKNFSGDKGTIYLYGAKYEMLDFDDNGILIGYIVVGGRYVDLIQERKRKQKIAKEILDSGVKIKEIQKILKKYFTNAATKASDYTLENIAKILND